MSVTDIEVGSVGQKLKVGGRVCSPAQEAAAFGWKAGPDLIEGGVLMKFSHQ